MGRTSNARERMIGATLGLVLGKSYDAATVEAICEQAEVRKGSFYHFFPSRTALMVAALEAHWAAVRPHLDAAFSSLVPPQERLRRFCRLQVAEQESGRNRLGCVIGCFMGRVASSLSPAEAEVRAVVRRCADDVLRYLEGAVREGQRLGGIRGGSPRALALLFFEYVQGVLSAARILDDLQSLRTFEARAMGLVIETNGQERKRRRA